MSVSSVIERVHSFWFAPAPVLPMCVARAVLGFVLLAAHLSLLPSYGDVIGADGLLGSSFMADVPGPTVGRATTQNIRWLQDASAPVVLGLYVLLLVSAAAFTVGFRTRLAGLLAVALHVAFHGRNEFVFWGWADMVTPFTLYVVFAPSGRRLSLDAFLRRRRELAGVASRTEQARAQAKAQPETQTEAEMEAWPLQLLRIHVCLVYVVAAWSRLDNPHWIDGSMLSRILADGTFSRAPALADTPAPLLALLTYLAWAVELVAPLSLWQSATRRVMVIALVVVHLGLQLATRVGWWNAVMIAGLVAFMPPSWFERLGATSPRTLLAKLMRWRRSPPRWAGGCR